MKRGAIVTAAAILLGGCSAAMEDQGKQFTAKLDAYTLRDIDRAYGWASLNNDEAAKRCLMAIRLVVSMHQAYHEPPGAFTLFQAGMDVTNPQGFLQVECGAEKEAVKSRVQLFLGKAATIMATFGL
jgi:hypothetical protein